MGENEELKVEDRHLVYIVYDDPHGIDGGWQEPDEVLEILEKSVNRLSRSDMRVWGCTPSSAISLRNASVGSHLPNEGRPLC